MSGEAPMSGEDGFDSRRYTSRSLSVTDGVEGSHKGPTSRG
jgi:hypothetical protein